MVKQKILDGVYRIVAADDSYRGFRKKAYTDYGVSFSSYLMEGSEGTIVLGTVPKAYLTNWLELIGKPDFLVIFGTNDDSAAVNALLEKSPKTVLIGEYGALTRLSGQGLSTENKLELRGDRTLTLAGEQLEFRTLLDRFVTSALYVISKDKKLLFTADAFGSLYGGEECFASEVRGESFLEGVMLFAYDIDAFDREKVMKKAAALVKDEGIAYICPASGPVIDEKIDEICAYICPERAEKDKPEIAFIYTQNGYTERVAEKVMTGVREAGDIKVLDCNLSSTDRLSVLKMISAADAFVFGTAEDGDGPDKAVLDIITSLEKKQVEGKIGAVFVSSISPGYAAGDIKDLLSAKGMKLDPPDFSVPGNPDEKWERKAIDFGYGVACFVLKIQNERKPVLVKCLVCGEIFDASLGICPVCGVGLERCVPAYEDEITFTRDSNDRYLIIGGGIAAISAAEAIRLRDKTGNITMLTASETLPINRPLLSKNFHDLEKTPEVIIYHEQDWYDRRGISIIKGARVTEILPDEKQVICENGAGYGYDKLIYALGCECFIPPFKGRDLDGVVSVRHFSDVQKILELCREARNAVVIGGGVIGMEITWELFRQGVKPVVLEVASQIMSRQLDEQSAGIIKEKMKGFAIPCYEGISVAEIRGTAGHVSSVTLEDGREFAADIVIIACGNRANLGPAESAGLKIGRSLVVNANMETSADSILACGDCVEYDGVNYQLWTEAATQGKVCGANAAGERIAYANRPLALTMDAFGTALSAIGDPGKTAGAKYKTVEVTNDIKPSHEKYWFFGTQLKGAVVIGDPERAADVVAAFSAGGRYNDIF